MSAAVAWDVAAAPARMPVGPVRPRLVSVPCGDEAAPRSAAPLRLTRAGRLTITLTALAVLTAVAMTLLPAGTSAPVVDHSTTVQQGQTLSEIAARQLPELPVADAVARIQVVNNLTTSQVHAGQALLIPAVG